MKKYMLADTLDGKSHTDRDLAPVVAAYRAECEAEMAKEIAEDEAASSMFEDFIA